MTVQDENDSQAVSPPTYITQQTADFCLWLCSETRDLLVQADSLLFLTPDGAHAYPWERSAKYG
jgi:hypothetical protein